MWIKIVGSIALGGYMAYHYPSSTKFERACVLGYVSLGTFLTTYPLTLH